MTKNKLERNRASAPGKIMSMPEGFFYSSGSGKPCDAAWGPCCCGAWHYGEMLPDDFGDAESLSECIVLGEN